MDEERSQVIGSEEATMPTASASHGWRAMVAGDLPRVLAIADKCHPIHPEDEAVFRERLDLFPGGCCVLVHDGETVGYIICHPGICGQPVPLDTLLGVLPDNADVLYIHDISIDLGMRGQGLASEAVEHAKLLARKHGFERLALVAVNRSQSFWEGHGFWGIAESALESSLTGYGEAGSYMACRIGS
jgi:GNAT superfamily N-acetyltransferase